eukprot:9767789-Alexandrium_andersonii.AAC.1
MGLRVANAQQPERIPAVLCMDAELAKHGRQPVARRHAQAAPEPPDARGHIVRETRGQRGEAMCQNCG